MGFKVSTMCKRLKNREKKKKKKKQKQKIKLTKHIERRNWTNY
jgi:hypothetical protein